MKLSPQKTWPLIGLVFVTGLLVGQYNNTEHNPFTVASTRRYNATAELNTFFHRQNTQHGAVYCVLPQNNSNACELAFDRDVAVCWALVNGQHQRYCCHTGGRRANRGCVLNP